MRLHAVKTASERGDTSGRHMPGVVARSLAVHQSPPRILADHVRVQARLLPRRCSHGTCCGGVDIAWKILSCFGGASCSKIADRNSAE